MFDLNFRSSKMWQDVSYDMIAMDLNNIKEKDILAIDDNDNSIADNIIIYFDDTLMKLYLDKANDYGLLDKVLNRKNIYGENCLMRAARLGNNYTVELLISLGVDIYEENKNNLKAIDLLLLYGDNSKESLEIFKLLYDDSFNFNNVYTEKNSTLNTIFTFGSEYIVLYFIEHHLEYLPELLKNNSDKNKPIDILKNRFDYKTYQKINDILEKVDIDTLKNSKHKYSLLKLINHVKKETQSLHLNYK